MYTILICDDEKDIVSALEIYLSGEGYSILKAYTGKEALKIVETEEIHLVLLDIMMPEMDGLAALIAIRKLKSIPIIFLSAKSEDGDKILGLNIGADDYVTKPFNPIELIARVRSQLRRYMQLGSGITASGSLRIGPIELDDRSKQVKVDEEPVKLTPKEFEILKLFMGSPNQVFDPKEIYEAVWDCPSLGSESTVAVHIRHLREKIEINPADPKYLKVVWGQGYMIDQGEKK